MATKPFSIINVAKCVLNYTQIVRQHNGRGRQPTYAADANTIASTAKQLAEMVLANLGYTPTTGIYVTREKGEPAQYDECWCCSRPVRPGCPEFLIDRETDEVLPNKPEFAGRGCTWPIGPECRKLRPGIDQYAAHPQQKGA